MSIAVPLLLIRSALAQDATPRLAETPEALPEAACGELDGLPGGAEPSIFLADRLRLTLPEGAAKADLPHDVMAADVSDQSGTLYFLEAGEDRMGVVANETFQLADADFLAQARTYLADLPAEGAPWNVAALPTADSGVRAVVYWPHQLVVEGDADVWALGALYALPDGGVAHLSFRLDTPTAARGLGCTGYAAKIAASAVHGDRVLTRAPRTELLDAAEATLKLDLPADMVLLPQPGPDFQVYYLVPLVPLGSSAPSVGIYIGGNPQELEPSNLPDVKGRLLGKKGAWSQSELVASDGSRTLRLERRVQVKTRRGQPPLYVHVFMAADNQGDLDRLRAIAEGMAWKKAD